MSRAERKAEKKAAKAEAKNKKKISIQDAYDESDRTMSDEEAHRDAEYRRPSKLKQISVVYMIQMKRFTKQRTIWLMLLLLAAIPFGIKVMPPGLYSANEGMNTLLLLMPLMSAMIVAFTCSAILPQEFNERTVYLSLPLPMSRFTFYIGKFLSGFSICVGMTLAAYGLALITAMRVSAEAFTVPIMQSIIVTVCGTFFLCAMAYMFSAKSKRGAKMKTLIVILAVLPVLGLLLAYLGVEMEMPGILPYLGYIPVFAPETALYLLGPSDPMLPVGSLFGVMSMMNFAGTPYSPAPLYLGSNMGLMCAVCVVLGLLCLFRGYRVIRRRDM